MPAQALGLRLSTAHDAVKLFSLVPNELKCLNALRAGVIWFSGLRCSRIFGPGVAGLSTAHDAVKVLSIVPNELKWLRRF